MSAHEKRAPNSANILPVRRIESLASDSPTLQTYLREIAKFPKLTLDQERELGRRIQQTSDEDALGALVESNLRFVVSYANRYRKLGVPVLDLIHEGNLGLIEAARRFESLRRLSPAGGRLSLDHAPDHVDDVRLFRRRLQVRLLGSELE